MSCLLYVYVHASGAMLGACGHSPFDTAFRSVSARDPIVDMVQAIPKRLDAFHPESTRNFKMKGVMRPCVCTQKTARSVKHQAAPRRSRELRVGVGFRV